MSRDDSAPASSTDELLERIHRLQEEIFDREDQIHDLLESNDSPRVRAAADDGEERRRTRHRSRLLGDWETLVHHSRELVEDDIDLIAALVRLVADLLLVQPAGVGERWIAEFEGQLAAHHGAVN